MQSHLGADTFISIFYIFKKTPKITIFMIDSYLFEILSKKNRISNVQDIKKIFSLFNQKNVN